MSGQFRTKNPDDTLKRTNPLWKKMMGTRRKEATQAANFLKINPVFLDHSQRHYNNKFGKQIEVRYGSKCPGEIGPNMPTILTAHQDQGVADRLGNLIVDRNPEAIFPDDMVEIRLKTASGIRSLIAINSAGVVLDECITERVEDLPSFYEVGEVSVKKHADRWTVEARIDASRISCNRPTKFYPLGSQYLSAKNGR